MPGMGRIGKTAQRLCRISGDTPSIEKHLTVKRLRIGKPPICGHSHDFGDLFVG